MHHADNNLTIPGNVGIFKISMKSFTVTQILFSAMLGILSLVNVAVGQDPLASPEYAAASDDLEGDNLTKNAVIEGIQVSSEPGEKPDEKVISCYFIFKDKPTSYFYEVKLKEQKVVFEFNDTKSGTAPVSSVSESPIKGFVIEDRKIDINKEVRGLKPEWHNQMRVIFSMEAIPEIFVNDEYNVITFNFKWTSNPALVENYIVKDNTTRTIWISAASVTGVGVGALVAWILNKPPPFEVPDIPVDDLPGGRPTLTGP